MTEKSNSTKPLRYIVQVVAGLTAIFGIGLAVLTFMVGGCDAFGGRCPADRPPLLEDDVFGSAFIAFFFILGGGLILITSAKQKLFKGLLAIAPIALVLAFLMRTAVHG